MSDVFLAAGGECVGTTVQGDSDTGLSCAESIIRHRVIGL